MFLCGCCVVAAGSHCGVSLGDGVRVCVVGVGGGVAIVVRPGGVACVGG